MKKKKVLLLLAAFCMGLSLTGCGSDSSKESSQASTEAPTEAETSTVASDGVCASDYG